jgi:16S rRNA (cytosine967-C5)-methyltransferase
MPPSRVAGLADAIGVVGRLDAPADVRLRQFFRARPQMGRQDRAFVAEGVFAYLRRRLSLEALAGTSDARHLALATLVRELGKSVREVDAALSGDEREWLAAFKERVKETLPEAVEADLPDWLWERLGATMGSERRAAFARGMREGAPLDLRVNALRATRDDALAALRADGLAVAPTPYSPWGLRVTGRPMLAQHPWLADGRLEVQDEGSQLIAFLVAPRRGEMVVDFCAGAGGKTLALGVLMRSQGRLYAFDTVERRLANLKPRLARSGLSNVHPQLIAHERDAKVKRLAGKVDRVLVDAPCTGTGTLRRNPDLKWRHQPVDVAELTAKQAAILASAATLVKAGGRVVYATCSVLPEENGRIVDAFLASHPGFELGDAQAELGRAGIPLATGPTMELSTAEHGCDAFYAAILERKRSLPAEAAEHRA